MTPDPRITIGCVVQINPEHDRLFGACLLVVTEMKSFGVQGYVTVLGDQNGGHAYYRVEFKHIAYIGPVEWAIERESVQKP